MTELTILSDLATISLFFGSLPSIVSVARNKNVSGFSTLGSFSFLAGQLLFIFFFAINAIWVTTALLVPLAVYWAVVFALRVKEKKKKKKKDEEWKKDNERWFNLEYKEDEDQWYEEDK